MKGANGMPSTHVMDSLAWCQFQISLPCHNIVPSYMIAAKKNSTRKTSDPLILQFIKRQRLLPFLFLLACRHVLVACLLVTCYFHCNKERPSTKNTARNYIGLRKMIYGNMRLRNRGSTENTSTGPPVRCFFSQMPYRLRRRGSVDHFLPSFWEIYGPLRGVYRAFSPHRWSACQN